jgi:DNA-binding NarL/FixJ family response regulator
MQVEDEILSEIEARDTAIMMKDKEIEQKSQEIEQQKSILRTTVRNLSQRGMSVKDIASVLTVSEEMVSALLSE